MHGAHPLGTIAHLWRYPVKSLAPESIERANVGESGFEGDRRSAFFVTSAEHARTSKTYRGKENNLLHTTSDAGRALSLAAARGVAIERRDGGPHFDLGTVSVVLDLWLGDLERLTGLELDPQRFRPNLFVRADPSFELREPALRGAILCAGSVRLRVTEPIGRCVTTTYDLASGESNPEILRAVARHRDNVMGIYCDVVAPGILERDAEMSFEFV